MATSCPDDSFVHISDSEEDYDEFMYNSESDDYGYESESPSVTVRPDAEKTKTVLGVDDLVARMERRIQPVAELCCVSSDEASRMLRAYGWNMARVQDAWFGDREAVCQSVGLLEAAAEDTDDRNTEAQCGICFEMFRKSDMEAAACRHYYCRDCWRGYLSAAANGGPSCLDIRCPNPECRVMVPQRIMTAVADDAIKTRWAKFALDAFVESQSTLTWCPAPDCGRASEVCDRIGNQAVDVSCSCGATYCFNCKEEAHRPVACDIVREWIIKESEESANLTWILAHTKACPSCSKPIEKNQGCMHMTCSQCGHQFCWLCLEDWKKHSDATGGFYECNRYTKLKNDGQLPALENARERARQSLERYMHYWQRWAENNRAKDQALAQLEKFLDQQQERLSEVTATPASQLQFIESAWRQVIDCRRILKWTYAQGYYMFGVEDTVAKRPGKEEFFVFNQGQAESYLEKLHHKVEKELQVFLGCKGAMAVASEWPRFREHLIGLTDVTRNHFQKLVDELERDFGTALNKRAK